MSAEPNLNNTDYELLSAYIDEMLTDEERSALEIRLRDETALRRELNALRQTVALVNNLPPLKAPRHFTLTPEMVGLSEPGDSTHPDDTKPARRIIPFPAMSIISAAASMVLIVVGFILIFSSGTEPATNAPQPMVSQITNSIPADDVEPPGVPAIAAAPTRLRDGAEVEEDAIDSNRNMDTADGVMDLDDADDAVSNGEMQDEGRTEAENDGYADDVTTFAMPTNPPGPANDQGIGGAAGTNLESNAASPSPMQTATTTATQADPEAVMDMEMMEEAAEQPRENSTGSDSLQFYSTETALSELAEATMMYAMPDGLMMTGTAPELSMLPTPTVSGTEVAFSLNMPPESEAVGDLETLLDIAGDMARQVQAENVPEAEMDIAPDESRGSVELQRARQAEDDSDLRQPGGIALVIAGIVFASIALIPWWRQRRAS